MFGGYTSQSGYSAQSGKSSFFSNPSAYLKTSTFGLCSTISSFFAQVPEYLSSNWGTSIALGVAAIGGGIYWWNKGSGVDAAQGSTAGPGSSKIVSNGHTEDQESGAAGSRRSGKEADKSGSETVKVSIHAGINKDGETTFKITTQPDRHTDYKGFLEGLDVALDDCTAEYSNLTKVDAEDCNTRFKKWVPKSKSMSAYTQSMGKIGIEVIYG